MEDTPDKMPDDLEIGLDGYAERENLQSQLTDALRSTVDRFTRRRGMSVVEVLGSIEVLKSLVLRRNQCGGGECEDGDEWKRGSAAP